MWSKWAVGFKNSADIESPAEFQEFVVFVGGVDEHRLTGLAAAQNEHVVVVVAHHDLVDLRAGVAVVQRHPGHPGVGVAVVGARWGELEKGVWSMAAMMAAALSAVPLPARCRRPQGGLVERWAGVRYR